MSSSFSLSISRCPKQTIHTTFNQNPAFTLPIPARPPCPPYQLQLYNLPRITTNHSNRIQHKTLIRQIYPHTIPTPPPPGEHSRTPNTSRKHRIPLCAQMGDKARKPLTMRLCGLYNTDMNTETKAVMKTVGMFGKLQRAGAGGRPVRVRHGEHHFGAAG